MIAAIIPFAIKLFGFLLDKYSANQEAKKAFIELVSHLEFGGLKSVGLNKSYREQIDARKKRLDTEENRTSKR